MTQRTEIGEIGEFGLIERLTKGIKRTQASTILGPGDDGAILAHDKKMTIVSTDLLVEGIHFDLAYTPLKHLGYKSVVVNLSDICAMNGTPSQITYSMAISNRFSVEAIEEIYAGVHLACEKYGVDLIGGDTTSSIQGLLLSITALGYADKDQLTYRNGAQNGDILCVTGDLGSAYLGLQLLEREKQVYLSQPDMQPEIKEHDYVIRRQLKPEARLDIVELFHKHDLKPTSMIDISDGVASELFHLCKSSNLGAYIEEAKLPIAHQAEVMALEFRMDPSTCALNGGEDYELLFTVSPDELERIKYLPDVSIIGEMVDKKDGIKLHTSGGKIHNLKAQGWRHFNMTEEE